MPPKKPSVTAANDDTSAGLTNDNLNLVIEQIKPLIQQTIEDSLTSKLTDILNSFANKHQELESKIAVLSDENDTLKRRVLELENYSRRDNLVLVNLPIASYSDAAGTGQSVDDLATQPSSDAVELSVVKFCNEVLCTNISTSDISSAHRIKPRTNVGSSSRTSSSQTIVRFTSRKARDRVFAARKLLKTHRPAVYINEHLTQDVARRFQQARGLVKDKRLHAAWTFNGMLYTKATSTSVSKLEI